MTWLELFGHSLGVKLLVAASGWAGLASFVIVICEATIFVQLLNGTSDVDRLAEITDTAVISVVQSDEMDRLIAEGRRITAYLRRSFVIARAGLLVAAIGTMGYALTVAALSLALGLVDRGPWMFGLAFFMATIAGGMSILIRAEQRRTFGIGLTIIYAVWSVIWVTWAILAY